MKVSKEDVVAGVIGISLALLLLGIPQAVWARLRGKAAPGPRFYIPGSRKRVDQLLHQLGDDEFPAQLPIHRRGQVVARLVREDDYQEVTGLMAEHLKHLADEARERAVSLDEALAEIDERRAERQLLRKWQDS